MSNQEPENNNLIEFIAATIEKMRDQMATKSDITRLEDKIGTETTAIRGDIEQVNLRLDSIERSIRGRVDQIEIEMSRV